MQPRLPISYISLASINGVMSYLKQMNAQFVFWIRSPNFERQLYVSPNYEAVWKRPCENLYKSPACWLETLLKEDLDRNQKEFNDRLKDENNVAIFRIITPSGQVRWIKDFSFHLYDTAGSIVAVAGVAECVTEKEGVILIENPHEKKLETAVMNMFVGFSQGSYNLQKNFYPSVNLFNLNSNQALYLDDLIIALSNREYECLDCLVSSMSAKKIGRQLEISHRTVETYLSNVKAKTKMSSNLELISKTTAIIKKFKCS